MRPKVRKVPPKTLLHWNRNYIQQKKQTLQPGQQQYDTEYDSDGDNHNDEEEDGDDDDDNDFSFG